MNSKGIIKCHKALNHLHRALNRMQKVRHWLKMTNAFNGTDIERLCARDEAASELDEACRSVCGAILKLASARNSLEAEQMGQEKEVVEG